LKKIWEDAMQFKMVFALSASAYLFFAAAAHSDEPGVMALTPSEMKWSAQGGIGASRFGADQADWRSQ
jgi:hypothetical protein